MPVGTEQGTIVGNFAPHTPVEVDFSPLERGIQRISERKQKSQQAAMANYDKFLSQDHSGRWASEMSKQHQELLDEYANLYARGINDPLRDPNALEFQKKVAQFNTKRAQANYLDNHLDSVAKMIATSPEGTYSDESIATAMDPVNMGFDDLLDANVASPQKKAPMADLTKIVDVYSKGLFARKGDTASMGDIASDAKSFVASAPPDVINSLKTYYDKLSPEEKMDLAREASKNQLPDPMGSGAITMAFSKLVDNQRKPFDFISMQDDIVKSIDPAKHSNEKYSGFTIKKEVEDALELNGMARINADPRILQDPKVMKAMGIDNDDSEADARRKARLYFRSLQPLVKNQDTTMRAPSGGSSSGSGKPSESEIRSSMQKWFADVISINPERQARALTFIDKSKLTKWLPGVKAGETIEDIVVDSGGVKAVVMDKDGDQRDIFFKTSLAQEEALKNMYKDQALEVKRQYETTDGSAFNWNTGKIDSKKLSSTTTSPKNTSAKEDW